MTRPDRSAGASPGRGFARLRHAEAWLLLLAVALIAASIPSVRLIPGWHEPWGLDLQNLYAFHTCDSRDDPYAATGWTCGDLLGRAMLYPPLLYASFLWMRLVSFSAARWIWAAFLVATLLAAAIVWSRPAGAPRAPARWAACALGVLLIAGFPAIFAIERGNNDILVVLAWTLAATQDRAERPFLTGALAGLAATLKLYPAFAALVLAVGYGARAVDGARADRVTALRFGAGLALVPVTASLLLAGQTVRYFRDVLPHFAAHLPAVSVYSHSIPATFHEPPHAARLVSAALVLAFCAAALLRFAAARREIFAGALALSTFVAGTSFDYNLITTYPLLVVLAARALSPAARAREVALLALGLVAVIGHRGLFLAVPRFHVGLQLAWLLATAALVVTSPPPPPPHEA